jgi:hypothetical protein
MDENYSPLIERHHSAALANPKCTVLVRKSQEAEEKI